MKKQIGVLGFQGDIEEHIASLESIGIEAIRAKSKEQINSLTHLIIPGGESTVIGRFLKNTGVDEVIKSRYKKGELKVYGTCAGAILLAKNVISPIPVNSLELIDITIKRNAYGSQIDSFTKELTFKPENKKFPATFIRAPRFENVSNNLEILVENDGEPVMLKGKNILVSAFHPELTNPAMIHEYFVGLP
jgi:5'-phosphate synthase pdxT subunit